MSDFSFEQKLEEMIESRRNPLRSPVVDRLKHLTETEIAQRLDGGHEEFYRELRTTCQCYPKGFVSQSRAVKEQMKADHIAAGVHTVSCPAYKARRDYEPWDFSAPSYTQQSARADEDAERVDYRAPRGRFEQKD